MPDRLLQIISLRAVHWLVFIVTGIALYGYTLNYPFIFDDWNFLVQNPLVKSFESFRGLRDIDEFIAYYNSRLIGPEQVSSFVLRPFAYLTFSLNYMIGGQNPSGYRMVNIAVHIANAIMLYQLLRSVIQRRGDETISFGNLTIPFFAALIFLVHPLQTQSVTYITQRFASLSTFFYLATILLYVRSSGTGPVYVRRFAYVGSIVVLLIGMLTKESVMTAPVALAMVDIILLRRQVRVTLVRLVPHFVCMSLIPLTVLNIANELQQDDFLFSSSINIVGGVYRSSEYAITQLRAILSYFRLLVLPYNQNFDPDYPLYSSLLHPEIVISIMVWLAFIAAGVCLLRRQERNICTDLTGFSIFWFPLAISVSSSFVPLTDLMSEHRTYLPSLAFCIGSVAYLHHLVSLKGVSYRNLAIGGLCLAVIVFGVLTVQRNQIYSSRISLWKDTIVKSPFKSRPYSGLGSSYHESRQYDQAIICYKKSLELSPGYADPYISLGAIYTDMDRPDEAIKLYERYLANNAPRLRILKNLAWAYVSQGRLQDAINTTALAIKLKPDQANLFAFFSELNLRAGNLQVAKDYFAKAKQADKDDITFDMPMTLDKLEKKIQESAVGGKKGR